MKKFKTDNQLIFEAYDNMHDNVDVNKMSQEEIDEWLKKFNDAIDRLVSDDVAMEFGNTCKTLYQAQMKINRELEEIKKKSKYDPNIPSKGPYPDDPDGYRW